MRHLPAPEGVTHREWWLAIKLSRKPTQWLPFSDGAGRPFSYLIPHNLQKLLHEIDRDASGRIEVPELVTSTQNRDRYLVSSLIEESITSSQLERAATTHKVAKQMLRQGRRPRNRGEQMIFNNSAGMRFIRENRTQPMTPELVLQLQSIMSDATLEDENAAGRWRTADDNVNASHGDPFVHPLIKAIAIHFMTGWIHPFVGDNDLTYFLDHQLHVVSEAIQALHEYLRRNRRRWQTLAG